MYIKLDSFRVFACQTQAVAVHVLAGSGVHDLMHQHKSAPDLAPEGCIGRVCYPVQQECCAALIAAQLSLVAFVLQGGYHIC